MEEILFIICGHQNTEEKKNVLIKTLKHLKEENINVCYCTHCGDYLDEISQYCKYISYVKDNQFIYDWDILKNIKLVSKKHIENYISYRDDMNKYYMTSDYILRNYLHDTYHTRPALILLKYGIDIAIQNKYTRVVYLESDIEIPNSSYRDILSEIVARLKQLDKKSFLLDRNNLERRFNVIPWTGFFVCDPNVFYIDKSFNKNWQRNIHKFIIHYGIDFFEKIILDIVGNSGCVVDSSMKFISDHWGTSNLNDINNFISVNNGIESSVNCSFYVEKLDNENYRLFVASFIIGQYVDKIFIDKINIAKGKSVVYSTSFDITNGSMYKIFDLGEVNINDNIKFYLNYSFEYMGKEYDIESTIYSSDLEKIHLVKRAERI